MTTRAKIWCEIHSYVSMFFLPLAVIYAVTGGLSIVGEHEGGPGRMGPPPSQQALPGRADVERHYPSPQESGREVAPGSPEEGREEGEGGPDMKRGGLLFKLTMLHKAKGGVGVKVLGMLFATAMVMMYFSGIWICWANRERRRRMLVTAAAGLMVTAVAIALL
jgi:hypothetical protein